MFDSGRTTEALLARRALAEKATPGPWEVDKSEITSAVYVETDWGHLICESDDEDAAHIAANSPDVVMADIDEILRLRAEVERLEKEKDWLLTKLADGCLVGESNCAMPSPCPRYPKNASSQLAELHPATIRCIDVGKEEWSELMQSTCSLEEKENDQ